MEPGPGSVVHPAAAGAGDRGPLRPHGGPSVSAYRPTGPVASRPYPGVVHVRPVGPAGDRRPQRHRARTTLTGEILDDVMGDGHLETHREAESRLLAYVMPNAMAEHKAAR